MGRAYTTPRLDKLGVRPGARVAIVGVPDEDVPAELAERTHDLTIGQPRPDTDVVLLAADSARRLGRPVEAVPSTHA